MCDTLCSVGPNGTLFAKNSDRPSGEVQLIEAHPPRPQSSATVFAQYLSIPDTGAAACIGARPDWLWGFEHGVNEHRVAIGNEKVFTTLDPHKQPAGLIGMDLVRLGVERARTADDALEVMTELLEEYGQGGLCDQTTGESYFSSFMIADPNSAWIMETSGRTWVAAPVNGSAAISNRLTISREWTKASPDVPQGAEWQDWRHPKAPTGHADVRLASSQQCIAARTAELTPADMAAHLRNHGRGPWGSPGMSVGDVHAPPESFAIDGTGVSVCMHLKGFQNTTSSMITLLPSDPATPVRVWVAPGQPCASVFLPVFPPNAVPAALGVPSVWTRFARLRDEVERDSQALSQIRAVFAPLESELWAEADHVVNDEAEQQRFVACAWDRVEHALDALLAEMPTLVSS